MGLSGSASGPMDEERTDGSVGAGSCPDEEELFQWAKGTLRADRRAALQSHMTQCSLCRATAAVAKSEPGAPLEATIFDGRYRLDEELGTGASSAVHRAFDERLGIDVALKLFRGADAAQVAQELLLSRKISHENVCRVFDTGTADGVAYLSMEYVEGETLAERLSRNRKLGIGPDPEAESILRQIIEGLGAAHAAGVIHRDLKAQNIMVAATGRVILTDFGLARLASVEESRAQLVGTPATWAPEQARGEPATFASDVYSFGVVAYRLLSGKEFKVSDPAALDAVPRRYRAALRRCLALSPGQRLADASEVKAAFFPQRHASWAKVLVLAALVLSGVGIAYAALREGPHASKEPLGGVVTLSSAPVVPASTASVFPAAAASTAPAAAPSATTGPAASSAHPVALHVSAKTSGAPSAPPSAKATATAPVPAAPKPTATASAGPDLLYAP
jgi:serine/threonine-protein kinase